VSDATSLNAIDRELAGADPNADLDLTPRDITPKTGARNWFPILVVVAVAAGIIAVLFTVLGDAALFIYNADQAVAEREELGQQRFRLQGSPVGNTVETVEGGLNAVAFTVNFEGQLVDVVHQGVPAEQFQSGVPVVLEGAWREGALPLADGASDGHYFVSDVMIVSHDNDYRLDNEQRLSDAEDGGQQQ